MADSWTAPGGRQLLLPLWWLLAQLFAAEQGTPAPEKPSPEVMR